MMKNMQSYICKSFFAVAMLLVLLPASAEAHKVISDAYASGDVIEGEVGFSDGEVVPNAKVEVFSESGEKIGETLTDEDGFFIYKPTSFVKHIFKVDLGAGHVAHMEVEIEDLPLIDGKRAPQISEEVISTNSIVGAVAVSSADLHAIRQELKLLRKEVIAYKEKNQLHSILGGIGYIFGLCGLFIFIQTRRQATSKKVEVEGAADE